MEVMDHPNLARNKLRMSFNSPDKVASHLGVNSKTDVDPEMWLRASLDGDRKAMSYIIGALKAYSGTCNTYGSGF